MVQVEEITKVVVLRFVVVWMAHFLVVEMADLLEVAAVVGVYLEAEEEVFQICNNNPWIQLRF